MRRLTIITATVLATLLGLLAFWQMREALVLLLGALVLASTLDPAVRRLMRRGLNRASAVAITFLGAILALGLAGTLFGGVLLGDAERALLLAPTLYERGLATLQAQGGTLGEAAADAPSTEELVAALANFNPGDVLSELLGLTSGLLSPLVFLLGAATLAFYWMLEQQRLEWLWLSLLPLQARTAARTIWAQLLSEVGIYIRATMVIVVLTTLLLTMIYSALELPFPSLLALIGGLALVIPWLGAAVGMSVAVLAALTVSPLIALLTLTCTIGVLLAVKLVAEPLLYREAVRVSPLLVVLALLALFELAGPLAILAAPPLAAAIHVLFHGLLAADRQERLTQPRTEIDTLQERLAALRESCGFQLIQRPQLRGMLDRAEQLLAATEEKLRYNRD